MNPRPGKTGQLIPIDLPEICAPRSQLMDIFQRAAAKRCVYVSAPAGSGKTVSALLWLKKSGHTALWISLDRYDNAPAEFYRVFLTALFSAIPQDESLMELIRGPAFGASPVEVTIDALTRISFGDRPCALVFDDFHLITNEEIRRSFYYVAKRLPLSFPVLILSRSEPPEAFSPYRDTGQIALIRGADLAFGSEEIRRHFASFGRFLTVKEAQDALAATEGWAIAVSAMAMSGSAGADEGPTDNPLRRYIAAQIWDKLDAALRRFMMRTAVVDKFTQELCQCVTQNPESRRILRSLLGENLFLSHQEGEFRYHPLFLDFLREELSKEAGIDRRSLHQSAAQYYYGVADYRNALYHFIQCGCSRGISDSLGRFLVLHVESSSDMSGIAYINRLPNELLEQNPCLHIGCAWCAFFFGEAQEMFFHLDRMYERIGEILGANRSFLEPALLHYVNDPRHTFAQQWERLRSAPVAYHVDAANIPKILSHKLPYFLRIYRDFSHYARHMEESFAQFRAVFSPLFGDHYAVLEAGMRSWLLYNQNRIPEALTLVPDAPIPGSAELTFLSKLQIASCLYAAGREDEAAQRRKELAALVRSKLLHLVPLYAAYETRLRLLDGDRAAAKAWFEHYFVDPHPQFYKLFLHSTTVRAYIVLGDYEKAGALCRRLRELCAGYRRVLDVAEADVLRCILLWQGGSRQEACDLLQRTLWDMQPYGYIRVFAEEGKAVLPMLKQLGRKSAAGEQSDMAGRAFLREVYLAAYEHSKRHGGVTAAAGQRPVRLSKQQRHVLELLSKGYKNSEIVGVTGRSINTIRYHTKIAYQKLDVTNAMDAVLRARELGLIGTGQGRPPQRA